jgi:hypothetical protein
LSALAAAEPAVGPLRADDVAQEAQLDPETTRRILRELSSADIDLVGELPADLGRDEPRYQLKD